MTVFIFFTTAAGANGAGKTTTLMTLSGVIRAKQGSIRFLGKDITRLAPEKIVAMGITQIPEGRMISPQLTVRENLLLGAYLRPRKANLKNEEERIFALFPILKQRWKQQGGTLSGGEAQRVALARALAASPRLLLLDEPFGALDADLRERLVSQVRGLLTEAGVSAIHVTHDRAEADAIADRVVTLDDLAQGD